LWYLSSGFLILVAVDYSFRDGTLLTGNPGIVLSIFGIMVAYIVSHVVANVAGYVLENKLVWGLLGAPEEALFAADVARARGLSLLWLLPRAASRDPATSRSKIRE
jgi:hypothetical protein